MSESEAHKQIMDNVAKGVRLAMRGESPKEVAELFYQELGKDISPPRRVWWLKLLAELAYQLREERGVVMGVGHQLEAAAESQAVERLEDRELPVPPRSAANDFADEVVRGWLGPDGFEIIVNPFMLEPPSWGIALVDIARNVARASLEPDTVLASIKQLFEAEWDNPTDTVKDSHDG